MKNLFLIMLANEREIRDYVFDNNYALYPANMQGYKIPKSLGVASKQVLKYVKETNDCVDVIKGVAVCSPLFPYLCDIKYVMPTDDWQMLMELHKRLIKTLLGRFDDVIVRIVEVDDPLAPVLAQIAQEFELEIIYAPNEDGVDDG